MKKALLLPLTIVLLLGLLVSCGKQPSYETDMNQLLTDLDTLTASPRPIGSQGEQEAAEYIRTRLDEMGYLVTVQPYTDDQGRSGSNVIAVKGTDNPDSDILVISTHHDCAPTAYGANDNASGVAAMLAVAGMLKDTKTDTELRFISFTDEENGKNGSRLYTSTLTEKERKRMVGCIQLDMLGGLGSQGSVVCTMDGQGNWLSDLLIQDGLSLAAETASDHASFQLVGVPSVLLTQNGRGFLYHTIADKADQLNPDAIAKAAKLTAQAVGKIAGTETPSCQDTIQRETAYRQTRQNVIYFDSSLADSESYIGAPGELVSHREESGRNWTDSYDTYRYSMLWFDSQEPMNTYYQYRNGFLQSIEIRPGETGFTMEQTETLLTDMYGAPSTMGTNQQEQPYKAWQDDIYSKYITLSSDPAGPLVTVSKYAVGISNTLATYPVVDGQAEISDPEDAKVWELLCSLIPQEYRKKIVNFQLFTDGSSNILAYTSPIREGEVTDNTRFSMTIDYYDVYDENGQSKDWSKLTYTLLHEYGHVLLEDETQVDLRIGATTHDPAGYIEGSFRKAFYDQFWAELGDSAVGDYEKNPSHYVSRYGANYFHEDIADTFAVFVLGGKPEGNTVAEEKLLLFWEDPNMVSIRSAVRENLGLSVG